MIWEIIKFEVRYRCIRPATYIYFLVLMLVSFLFSSLNEISISDPGEQLYVNAPNTITLISLVIMLMLSIIAAATMGVPVYRDYDHNFYEIIYSTGVKKREYLWGRFLGSYLLTIFIYSGITIGMIIGHSMPWHDPSALTHFNLAAYLNPFFLYIVPNLFIIGTFFFIVGSYFKSQLAVYIQGIIFLFLYFTISIITDDVSSTYFNSLFDPFGLAATDFTTSSWTSFEKNTMLVPFRGAIVANRLLWTGLSMIAMLLFTWSFKFNRKSIFTRKKRKESKAGDEIHRRLVSNDLPKISHNLKTRYILWWHLTKFHFKDIVSSVLFITITVCAIGLSLFVRWGGAHSEMPTHPVTYMLIDYIFPAFIVFIVVLIIIYAGELIWNDIKIKFSNILDSIPISNHVLVFSKFSALILIELLLLFLMALLGITIQTFSGFYQYQFVVYLKILLLHMFPGLLFITIYAFLVHTLINNKFLGHLLVIVLFLQRLFTYDLGMDHILLKYGQSIKESYSGMNGLANFVFPTLAVDFYWLMLGIIFLFICILGLKRGSEYALRNRYNMFKNAWKYGKEKYLVFIAIVLFIVSGIGIYYNTNKLNTFQTKKQNRIFRANYEKRFSKYKNYPLPSIIDVFTKVDIFPKQHALKVKGTYLLTNKNDERIDTLHLRLKPEIQFTRVEFNFESQLISEANEYGYYLYILKNGLNATDTLRFDFEIEYEENGFSNDGRDKIILSNGTYITNEFLPYFGYDESFILKKESARKKAGLEEYIAESHRLNDTFAYVKNSIDPNACKIEYETVVSTESDQIALTTGTLQKEWMEKGRRYFHYKMNGRQWNSYPIFSARYEVFKDSYNHIDVAVFYYKEHDFNLNTIVNAVKKTIEYCDLNIYPYLYKEIRIAEYPRYYDHTNSYEGIIPMSERDEFILRENRKNGIDIPFYYAAYKTARQWWNQMISAADVQGKLLLNEALANYTALMVMKQDSSLENIQKILKFEQTNYKMKRGDDKDKEVPLYLAYENSYISKNKGTIALYSLQDFIGEKDLNKALSNFMQNNIFNEKNYSTSLDLIEHIREVTPDTLEYLIDDLFKSVILFNNRIDSSFYSKRQDGKYDIKIYVTSEKFSYDSTGMEKIVIPSDWIDIGIFTRSFEGKDSLVYLDKKQIISNQSEFNLTLDIQPLKVGIDPYYKILDKQLDDNIADIRIRN